MNYKDIETFGKSLRVFEDGTVQNIKTGVVYKWTDNGSGYKKVAMHVKPLTKNLYIHRLVAECFLEKPSEGHNQVNHKDGNKENNHKSNLEWVTGERNIRHAHETGAMQPRANYGKISRLSLSKVCEMYVDVKRGATVGKTARQHSVSRTTLSSVMNKHCHGELTDFLDEHLA